MKKKSKFLTFLFSLVPGVGHYYLGLMKRGLQFMVAFGAAIGVLVFFDSLSHGPGDTFAPMMGIALPIIWFYSVFDAQNLASKIKSGEVVEDSAIFAFDPLQRDEPRNAFWTFVLSIFPGLGHLYLGLFRRGSQIMAGFLIAVVAINLLRVDLLFVLLPVIWFISLFDALERMSKLNQGAEVGDDSFLQTGGWKPKQRWIGVALVLLGIYMVVDRMLFDYIQPAVSHYFSPNVVRQYFDPDILKNQLQTIIVALIIIFVGIKLLKGGKRHSKAGEGA
jgi:hypothetical protein